MKALITGASSGLGKNLAIELSNKGYEVVLVARNHQALQELQTKLKIKSEKIIADLTNHDDIESVCQYIRNEAIDLLINNAGIGSYGNFWEIPAKKEIELYTLNMIAPALLMKAYIASHDKGRIVNISSIAAMQVDPLMASYGASKTFLLRLGKSVEIELAHSQKDILVQTCLPGSFISSFDKNSEIEHSKAKLESEKIAELIISDIFKNKRIIIPSKANKLAYYGGFLLPEKIMAKIEYSIQKSKKNRDI